MSHGLGTILVTNPGSSHFGVVAFGVIAFGVVVSPAPAALLFLLSFFSLLSLGIDVVGLFSPPFVNFLAGAGRSSVLSCGVRPSLAGVGALEGVATVRDWEDLFVVMEEVMLGSCDLVSLKDPGSPTIGFSSMYS